MIRAVKVRVRSVLRAVKVRSVLRAVKVRLGQCLIRAVNHSKSLSGPVNITDGLLSTR